MQVHPIFPPREDVHVGDIYWLDKLAKSDQEAYCRDGNEFLPIPPLVTYVDVRKRINTFYTDRPSFPRSVSSSGTVTLTASGLSITPSVIPTSVEGTTTNPFTAGNASRSRLVGFPDMMSVRVRTSGLGAILPVEGILASLGVSSTDVREASLSIPVAESYGVPAGILLEGLNENPRARNHVLDFRNGLQEDRSGGFHLVTEVYYARAIDVNIVTSNASSLGLGLGAGAALNSVPAVTFTSTVTPATPGAATATQQISQLGTAAFQMLQARSSVPGVTVSYGAANSNTIRMRRVFDQPVAIGFKSMLLVLPAKSQPKAQPAPGSSSRTTPSKGPAAASTASSDPFAMGQFRMTRVSARSGAVGPPDANFAQGSGATPPGGAQGNAGSAPGHVQQTPPEKEEKAKPEETLKNEEVPKFGVTPPGGGDGPLTVKNPVM